MKDVVGVLQDFGYKHNGIIRGLNQDGHKIYVAELEKPEKQYQLFTD